MKQFPEHLATPQDVENIRLHHPEYHRQLKEYLQRAHDEPDEATQVISHDIDPDTNEMINIKTKIVKKEKMKYKDLGFEHKNRLAETITDLSVVDKTIKEL